MRASMHPRFAIAFVFVLTAVLPCVSQKQETQPEYASLLARVKTGDLTVDFKRLRFSYMESPERRKAKDTSEEKKDMFGALDSKDYKKAIEKAEVVLASEFVDMEGHFVEYIAYRELQEPSKSVFHKAIYSGLLKSITDSRDGKSKETAYVVISTNEEYVLLNVLGLRPWKQSVIHDGGHSYDLLEVRNPNTNQTVKLYFNIDIPFKHYLD